MKAEGPSWPVYAGHGGAFCNVPAGAGTLRSKHDFAAPGAGKSRFDGWEEIGNRIAGAKGSRIKRKFRDFQDCFRIV